MSQLRVLVVGASIAGPIAAYWFAKTGATITVIERFPELRKGGQNIDIRTAGVTVMRRTPGLEDSIRSKIVPLEGLSFVREDGRPYGVLTATGNPDQQALLSEYEIFRGDLAKILYDMTKDNENIKYVFGEQVASIQQAANEDGPVQVEFLNGTPGAEYDLVVACDGATSRTRAIGLNCSVRDHVKPTNSWAAYFSIKGDLLQGSKIGKAHSAIGGRFIAARPDPAGITRIAVMGCNPRNGPDAAQPFREAMKNGETELKNYVARVFRGVGWKTNEIMAGMMESTDFYGSEVLQVMTPKAFKGRFAMVGDAGYAPGPTGGGTTLAMAGAYVLAGEICKHRGDIAAGLNGYEEVMRPLITEMQKIPAMVPAVMAPQTAWGLWLRNTLFTILTGSGIINFVQKYFATAFGSVDEFPLPEYTWVK